jgi:hypothetical protein
MGLTAKDLSIEFLVESDQQCSPAAERRRPQVAGRTENVREERRVVRSVGLQVKGHNLLPPGNDHSVGRPGKRQRFAGSLALFAGIAPIRDWQAIGVKVPLSLLAAYSAFAMVQPVNPGRHYFSLLRCENLASRAP